MKMQLSLYGKLFLKLNLLLDLYMYIYKLLQMCVFLENKNKILSGGGKNLIEGGKWGQKGREAGAEGEVSGDQVPPVHPLPLALVLVFLQLRCMFSVEPGNKIVS